MRYLVMAADGKTVANIIALEDDQAEVYAKATGRTIIRHLGDPHAPVSPGDEVTIDKKSKEAKLHKLKAIEAPKGCFLWRKEAVYENERGRIKDAWVKARMPIRDGLGNVIGEQIRFPVYFAGPGTLIVVESEGDLYDLSLAAGVQ